MSLTTRDVRALGGVFIACLTLAVLSGVAVHKALNFFFDLIRTGELPV